MCRRYHLTATATQIEIQRLENAGVIIGACFKIMLRGDSSIMAQEGRAFDTKNCAIHVHEAHQTALGKQKIQYTDTIQADFGGS
jgi:hypothetical protein